MAIDNAKAVLEAIFGHQSAFVRTPKYGVDRKEDRRHVSQLKRNGYRAIKSVVIPVLEIACGTFFLNLIIIMIRQGHYLSPILMIPFLGFYYTGFCSLGRMISNLLPAKQTAKAKN